MTHETLRLEMGQVLLKKREIERFIDAAVPSPLFGVSSGRWLRAGSRHYGEAEFVSVLAAEVARRGFSHSYGLTSLVSQWWDQHVSYEALVGRTAEIRAEVSADRFRRALADSANWDV